MSNPRAHSASLLEENLDELYEHAPCGYLSMLPNGTIVKVNATLAEWLGSSHAQLIGRTFQDLLTVPGRIFHDTHYMPLLTLQGFVREIALDLQRPGGSPLPTILSTIARRSPDGRVVLYRTTLFDCSERRSYERELLRERRAADHAASAKAAVLAMVSHDMRSPLGSIVMAAEMLESTNPPPPQDRYVEIVKTAARTVLELVESILEHSKLDSGTAVWLQEEMDLRALAAEIATILSVKIEAKGLTFDCVIDPQLPPLVRADRFKLGQILTNLLSNAIKFTERGRISLELRVRTATETTVEVELRVTDTGIGIPSDKLTAIFEEFQQASDSTARRFGGTGLGLAISQKLARLAGSAIHVESTLGQGTSFWCALRLPIADSGLTAT